MACLVMTTLVILSLLLPSLSVSSAAKILLIPAPHYGHVNFFGVAGKHLKTAGHETWIYAPDMFEERMTKLGIKTLIYNSDFLRDFQEKALKMTPGLITGETSTWDLLKMFSSMPPHFCKQALGNENNMKKIEDLNFDLVIMDGVPILRCGYVIPYKYNIKYITLTAASDPWAAGIPAMPSTEPFQILPYTNQMTFIARTFNSVLHLLLDLREYIEDTSTTYIEEYAPNKPSISLKQLHRASELWLVNLETICLDFPRVSMPHYHFLGGVSVQHPKPLTGAIADFVAGANHGIIIMSFSSFKPFNHALIVVMDKLLEGFAKIPQRVILQQDPERLKDFKIPSNVLPLTFLPQNDLLGHPKTVLFMTHCGNNGQMEAVYHGVPMLGMPLMAEQKYNAQRMVARGYGLALDLSTFSVQDLVDTIDNIITNSSFREKTQKCSKILRSMPSTGDAMVHWVEHVLQFGGSHLRPASLDMYTFQMLNMDVWAFCIFLICLLVFSLICICRCCIRFCCKRKRKPKVE